MTVYRYLFADLLTNQVLAELPITNVNFTQQLNSAGSLSGSILLSDVTERTYNIYNSTIPARTALYVDRDGVLVWGGIIWSRDYDSATQHLAINAQEFESYFSKRRITANAVFTSTDQLTVAQSLVTTAQSATGGNINVLVGSETSGILVSRTYYASELKPVYQALIDLSQSTQGFDFNIQVAYNTAMQPTKTLVLGYPQGGTRYSSTNASAPVFEFPSANIIDYQYKEDGSLTANKFTVFGAGSNEGQLQSVATNTSQITSGWPLLEDVANYSDLNDSTLLTNIASGRLNAVINPPVTLQIVAPPYVAPTLGTYGIGDDIRIRIVDDRFPNGLDAIYRLVGLTVTPGESTGERVVLSLTLPSQ
jgi:hypothetical protein